MDHSLTHQVGRGNNGWSHCWDGARGNQFRRRSRNTQPTRAPLMGNRRNTNRGGVDSGLRTTTLDTMQLNEVNTCCGQSEIVRMGSDNMYQSSESINTDESIPHGMASRRSCSWLARSASRPKIPRWCEQHWSLRTCTCKRNGWFMACTDGIKTPSGRSINDYRNQWTLMKKKGE